VLLVTLVPRSPRSFALAATVAAVTLLAGACGGSSSHASSQSGSNSSVSSNAIVWPRPDNTGAAINAAGLPALPAEALSVHYHAHLDVIIDGQPVIVAQYIGIDIVNRRISPLHTHDSSGIIHVESPEPTTYTLGQFFTEWAVRLTAQCIDTYCAGPTRQNIATVNGQTFNGDPSTIPFFPHAQITLWSGPPGPPPPLPSSYNFPRGD
jgi:hypothetical protein